MSGQYTGNHSNTTLHGAVAEVLEDVLQVFIDAGEDIEERDFEGYTPLLFACVRGCLGIVKVLLQAGAELHVTDHYGDTCLIAASREAQTETVRYLVGLGVDMDEVSRTQDAYTALHKAVRYNHVDVMQVLIDAGADIEKKDAIGCSSLLLACMRGCLDAVKVLVQAGAELRVTDYSGCTCLVAASTAGHTETVRYLVGLGRVDVDQVGGDYNTALLEAVRHNHADVMQVLIDAGADIEKKDPFQCSPLLSGCESSVPDVVKVLVRAGADVGARDRDGKTCLMIVSARGFATLVKSLLCMGEVGVDLVDAQHWTALHHAVANRRAAVVQVLIDAGADVEAKSELVCSPLMMACRAGEVHIVRMLLEAGVRLHIQGNGNIRFDAAARYPKSYAAEVQELIDSGARIEKWDDGGPSPLVCKCMGENRDIVKLLVEAGAELRVTEHIEELSQHFEATAGDRKEHKIQKVTCLITAAEEGGTETVRYLMVGVEQEVDQAGVVVDADVADIQADVTNTEALGSQPATPNQSQVLQAQKAAKKGEKQEVVKEVATAATALARGVKAVMQSDEEDDSSEDEDSTELEDAVPAALSETDSAEKKCLREKLEPIRAAWEHMATSLSAPELPLTLRQVVSMQEAVQNELIQRFTDCTDSAEKELLRNKLLSMRATWEHMAESRQHAEAEPQPVDADVSRTDVTNRAGSNTLRQVVNMQEEVQKELIQRFTDCTDSAEQELLRNRLLSMRATWEHMAESRQHPEAEQQPVDADVSRTGVTNTGGSNTLRQVADMQEEVQKELIQRFTDCTDSAEKELLRNTLLSMRATWEHMAESRQHAEAEPQPVDSDVSRTGVTNTRGCNTLRQVADMQEEVQKELIQRFTDCTDSAEKELLCNTLLSMRATWEHMAESRQHPEAEQQPVDADVSRSGVTNTGVSNTLREVADMQEEVQKELIQRFTDCTDSAEKELLRNTLLSMRATWEHMAESRQHPEAEPQPVDVSRTAVMTRRSSNTLSGRHAEVRARRAELKAPLRERLSSLCRDGFAAVDSCRDALLALPKASFKNASESLRSDREDLLAMSLAASDNNEEPHNGFSRHASRRLVSQKSDLSCRNEPLSRGQSLVGFRGRRPSCRDALEALKTSSMRNMQETATKIDSQPSSKMGPRDAMVKRKGTLLSVEFGIMELADNNTHDTYALASSLVSVVLDIIQQESGNVFQLRADGLIASWNTHHACARHGWYACRAALEIRKAMEAVEDPKDRVGWSVSIASGNLYCGNIGNDEHKSPFVLGSVLDDCRRLNELSRVLQTPIIISEAVQDVCTIPDMVL